MENPRRTDYRNLIYRELSTQRVKAVRKRSALMLNIKNTHFPDRVDFINGVFFRYTGLDLDYHGDLRSIMVAMNIMIPHWDIQKYWMTGEYHRVTLVDRTGTHPEFICRFVSKNLQYVLMYAIMTVYVMEANRLVDMVSAVPSGIGEKRY